MKVRALSKRLNLEMVCPSMAVEEAMAYLLTSFQRETWIVSRLLNYLDGGSVISKMRNLNTLKLSKLSNQVKLVDTRRKQA